MSGWWDATALASIATNAIKTAQKRIDKVLDIKEEEALRIGQTSASSSLPDTRPADTQPTNEPVDDDISSERTSRSVDSAAHTFQPIPSDVLRVKVTSESDPIAFHEENVMNINAESSSLLAPVSELSAFMGQSSPASPDFNNKLDPGGEASKGMVSSSEDTLVSDSIKNDDEPSDFNSTSAPMENIQKPSPIGSHTPVSTRSLESPSFSEANSSCMGSELIRVDVAPSTSSDIEIVSTPSSCCVENYIPVQQPGDSRHFRPLAPAGVTIDHMHSSQKRDQTTSIASNNNNTASSVPDATAGVLMKQLAEITRSVEKKDARILELSEENTLLHTQLMEIRRQVDSAAAADAAFGADTVRLLKNEIKDRDQIISELREEGEKLSKQQAQGSVLIKKLRAKEKELDGQIAEAQRKNDDLQAKVLQLERSLTLRLDGERQSAETIQQLTTAVKRMEREVAEKQEQLSDAKNELSLLEKRVSSVGDMSKERESKLLERIDQLGDLVRELEEKTLVSERQRKSEIAELEAKLEAASSYAEQLREGATSAAFPVLKQLENLQQSYASASKNWNDTERSMSTRIAQLEQILALAETRAREAEASAATNEKKQREQERALEVCRLELTKCQASLVQLEADRDIWKRRVANLESMCEQERARAAGYERRATESESRLSVSSSSNQRRCTDLEASLQKLEREHAELTIRYEKLLEMYGEKVEEAEDLRADVAELREVFREHFANYGTSDNNKSSPGSTTANTTGLSDEAR